MRLSFVTLLVVAICASEAAAQTTPAAQNDSRLPEDFPFFAHANVGGQSQSQEFTQRAEFTLYNEPGSWEAVHRFEGGRTFDVGGGVRLGGLSRRLRHVSAGATFVTRATHDRDVVVTALLPHPIFTDAPRTATQIAAGLQHSERALHLQAFYHVPVTLEFDVTLFGGPSFFSVRDEFIEAVTTSEAGGDFSTVNLQAGTGDQSVSPAGFNVGVDVRYMVLENLAFMRGLGVGVMLRYSRATFDLELPPNTSAVQELEAGGPELAAGIRIRF